MHSNGSGRTTGKGSSYQNPCLVWGSVFSERDETRDKGRWGWRSMTNNLIYQFTKPLIDGLGGRRDQGSVVRVDGSFDERNVSLPLLGALGALGPCTLQASESLWPGRIIALSSSSTDGIYPRRRRLIRGLNSDYSAQNWSARGCLKITKTDVSRDSCIAICFPSVMISGSRASVCPFTQRPSRTLAGAPRHGLNPSIGSVGSAREASGRGGRSIGCACPSENRILVPTIKTAPHSRVAGRLIREEGGDPPHPGC